MSSNYARIANKTLEMEELTEEFSFPLKGVSICVRVLSVPLRRKRGPYFGEEAGGQGAPWGS
jgi:hypothetical protein